MKEIIKKALSEFVSLANESQDALKKKYKLNDIPFNCVGLDFPPAGSIVVRGRSFHYRFHGSSCQLEDGRTKMDFHINPTSVNKIGVSLFYFAIFLKSFSKDEAVASINPSAPVVLNEQFNLLVNEGFLKYSINSKGIFELVETKLKEE